MRDGVITESASSVSDGREQTTYTPIDTVETFEYGVVTLSMQSITVDKATGLPVSRVLGRPGDLPQLIDYWDYEDVSGTDTGSLFSSSAPPGMEILGDEGLPVDPSLEEQTISQAADNGQFAIYWLGPDFKGVPLDFVSKMSSDGMIKLAYRFPGGSDEAAKSGYRQYTLHQFRASPAQVDELRQSLTAPRVRTSTSGTYTLFSGGPDNQPVLIEERGNTVIFLGMLSPATDQDILDMADAIVEVPR